MRGKKVANDDKTFLPPTQVHYEKRIFCDCKKSLEKKTAFK